MPRIENELAVVEVKTQAAEITSFYDKEKNIEHMWQGDPQFWAGRNPILFPMVGSTWTKDYQIDGKTYKMGNHGFARHSEFTVESVSDDTIVLSLSDNAETLAQYPFAFKLTVTYQLTGKQLTITYQIENHSPRMMPFSFGLHPAFNCPMRADERFEDYKLVFACPETQTTTHGVASLCLNEEREIALDYATFKNIPTLLFEHLRSPYVTLTNGKNSVKVSIAGYRWVAFWTKQNAPYLCIEPWHGHGDFEEVRVPFEEREGTIQLKENGSFTTSYTIEIG